MSYIYSVSVKWKSGEQWTLLGAYRSLRAARRDADSFLNDGGAHAARVEKWVKP